MASKLPVGFPEPFPRARFMDFISRVRIQTKDYGLIPLRMLGTQMHVLDEICAALERGTTTFYILKARQLGMTTFFLLVDMFWAMEHGGLLASFVTHTDQAKANFRNTIKLIISQLPKTHKIRWDQENRDMIVFKNSSVIQYLVAGTKEKAKGGLGRSSANNFIHATEVAFWGSPDDLNELAATMSTHYPFRMKIEETTANGFNFWEERWRDAEDDPSICRIFVGWWRHDHYRFHVDDERFKQWMPHGVDGPLTMLERKRRNEVKKRYDVLVSHEQIAWYRWKLQSECGGDQTKMDEMFPWVPEDAFVATGRQYFLNPYITEAMKASARTPYLPFKYTLGETWRDTMVQQIKTKHAELKVWEEADPEGHYAIACDPAYGSGPDADSTAINVIRCFADRVYQVAEFCTPNVSTYQCAWVLCHLAGYYRNVQIILEITGPGAAVYQEMMRLRNDSSQMVDRHPETGAITYDLRYVFTHMRQYLYTRVDSFAQTPALHWKMNNTNKFQIYSYYKDMFERHLYTIRSMNCLHEMKTVVIDQGFIGAEPGKHDDLTTVGALALEAYRHHMLRRLDNMGLTYKSAMERKEGRAVNQASTMSLNYLSRAGVLPPNGQWPQ